MKTGYLITTAIMLTLVCFVGYESKPIMAQQAAPVAPRGSVPPPDRRAAFDAVEVVIRNASTRCPLGGQEITKPYSFSTVVSLGAQPSPFSEQLVPPGTLSGARILGYQQYRLYASPTIQGHYIWHLPFQELPVSNSDRFNGVDARFQIDLYAVSYRLWDVSIGRWSNWTTNGSFGNDVHFANFIVEHRGGVWAPRGTIYMQPMGAELRSVDCQSIPAFS
jgi:hypothetical protein